MADQPVLGMILKGYPRISEAFISNEIALMEKLGFSVHIYSMHRPRENFSHESVKQIRATVDTFRKRCWYRFRSFFITISSLPGKSRKPIEKHL